MVAPRTGYADSGVPSGSAQLNNDSVGNSIGGSLAFPGTGVKTTLPTTFDRITLLGGFLDASKINRQFGRIPSGCKGTTTIVLFPEGVPIMFDVAPSFFRYIPLGNLHIASDSVPVPSSHNLSSATILENVIGGTAQSASCNKYPVLNVVFGAAFPTPTSVGAIQLRKTYAGNNLPPNMAATSFYALDSTTSMKLVVQTDSISVPALQAVQAATLWTNVNFLVVGTLTTPSTGILRYDHCAGREIP